MVSCMTLPGTSRVEVQEQFHPEYYLVFCSSWPNAFTFQRMALNDAISFGVSGFVHIFSTSRLCGVSRFSVAGYGCRSGCRRVWSSTETFLEIRAAGDGKVARFRLYSDYEIF